MSVHEEALLWKFIDGECTPEEASLVDQLLQNSPYLQGQFHLMLAMHQQFLKMDRDDFSPPQQSNESEDSIPLLYQKAEFSPMCRPVFLMTLVGLLGLGTLYLNWFQLLGSFPTMGPKAIQIADYNQHWAPNGWLPLAFILLLIVVFFMAFERTATKQPSSD
jgi:hypothetical protein